MKTETLYRKEGRKYVPVSEMQLHQYDTWPEGVHVVVCRPGWRSVRFKIEPDTAAIVGAGRLLQDKIQEIVAKAVEMRPTKEPVTQEQAKAWENLKKAFGNDRYAVQYESIAGIADEITQAIVSEAFIQKGKDEQKF